MNIPVLYTDGACLNNPGYGAWCSVLLHNQKEIIMCGRQDYTTNNRMESLALICALRCIVLNSDVRRIKWYSDSMYAIGAVKTYRKKQVSKKKHKIKNLDLWQEFWRLMNRYDFVIEPHWVRGHSGDFYNEKCNDIAEKIVRGIPIRDDITFIE